MRSLKRRLIVIAAAAFVLNPVADAMAQNYPDRPIRMVMPGAAGGSPDILARLIAQPLGELLGQPVVVDNVAGAAGIIGTDKVAKSPADGYTLLYGFNQIATMNPALYAKLPYQPEKDLVPVGLLLNVAYMLIASPSLPAKNLADLIAMAKAKPNKLTYASTGVGSAAHLGVILLDKMAGIEMLHVPYKAGSAANADIMAGVVDVRLDAVAASLELAKGGKVKVLGVTSDKRIPALPDVATFSETLPGYVLTGWQGIWAPAGTPEPIVQKLNAALKKVMEMPKVRKQITDLSYEPAMSSPEEMAKRIRKETEQWATTVKEAGITPQ